MKASSYRHIFSLGLSALIMSCTSNGTKTPVVSEVEDSIHTDTVGDIDFSDEFIDEDSAIRSVFSKPESFEQTPEYALVSYSFSEDGKAKLITIRGGGSMDTGTSYVQYKKGNGDVVLKKVAYAYEAEEGGMVFPSCFREIHDFKGGYNACGTFSFSSNEKMYRDTLFISKTFLNSDKWEMEHR